MRVRMNGPACQGERRKLESQGLIGAQRTAGDHAPSDAEMARIGRDELVAAFAENETM
jgi:hypothetical protein